MHQPFIQTFLSAGSRSALCAGLLSCAEMCEGTREPLVAAGPMHRSTKLGIRFRFGPALFGGRSG
jgi:hypothetical protein